MVTQRQHEAFAARGLIRLDGFLPADKVTRARDVVLRVLERRGVWREGRWHLDDLPPSTAVNAGASLVKGIRRAAAFSQLMTKELLDVITELLDGRSASPLTDFPQLLFTLPNASAWTVPHSIWHLDIPRLPNQGIPGIQVFTFLNTVQPGGGGTLVVAGSHRLLNTDQRISSKQVKRRLKKEPYFRDLMSKHATDRDRFVQQAGRVGDIELQVAELHGNPGDVFLTDLRLLHTLAPNTAPVPRMMLTHRYLLESLLDEIHGPSNSGDGDAA